MRHTGLLFASVLAFLSGCVTKVAGPSPDAHTQAPLRLALPAEDPILKAIDFHLRKSKTGVRPWKLGPDLTAGEKLPEQSVTAPPVEMPAIADGGQQKSRPPHVSPVRAEIESRPLPVEPSPGTALAQQTGLPAVPDAYRLRSGDIIDIAVSGQPELSGTVRVRHDGNTVLPNVGIFVRAKGMSPSELAGNIAAALYGDYLKSRPKVSVEVLEGPEYFVIVRTATGRLIPIPASEATTLGSLVIHLGTAVEVTSDTRFVVSYPGEDKRLEIQGNALLRGRSGDLRLEPGCYVEIIQQPARADASTSKRNPAKADPQAADKHHPAWASRTGRAEL